jgi:hypothetical protein
MAHSGDFYLLGVVPIENFAATWDAFNDLLIPAFCAAKNTDPCDLRLKAAAGTAHLWAVFNINPVAPVGVFFTELVEKGGRRIMCGHTMSGRGLRRWAHLAQGAVEHEARKRNCDVVQVMGRRALLRVWRGYTIVGEARPGEMLFEKAL